MTFRAFCVFSAVSAFALFGHADSILDVTSVVRNAVVNGSLAVVANNATFGEPVAGVAKKLRVDYSIDGVADFKTVFESGTLRIDVPAGKKLVIIKAVYGDLTDTDVNVEVLLNAAIKDNKLNITVNNAALGGDPAPKLAKTLVVSYTVNGKPHAITMGEDETLALPDGPDGTGQLIITKAVYGTN
jgi:hypothetical protein